MKQGIVDIRVELNMPQLNDKFNALESKANTWLKNEVAKDSEKYVPFRTGALARSVQSSIGTADTLLIYNTPYASRMYNGQSFNFSRTVHPSAGPSWFERAKAINKAKWVNGVDLIKKGVF